MSNKAREYLRAFERLAEAVVEGSAHRLFRSRLQPILVARLAARALLDSQQLGPQGPEVAGAYLIHLHPSDWERFSGQRRILIEQVRRFLIQYAHDRSLRFATPLSVEIVSDSRVPAGTARVDARFLDFSTLFANHQPVSQTTRLSVAGVRAALPTAFLELGGEQRVTLERGQTTLGRALDNDVVIEDPRVSRRHAVIERLGERFVVRDLGSSNGTLVGGVPAAEAELHDGDEISLGGYRLTFRLESADQATVR